MYGYIDIHSHILPGVDDGPRDMDETRLMLTIAYEEGFRIIVATPHYSFGKVGVTASRLFGLCEEVTQEAEEMGLDMQIVPGNEILYSSDCIGALEKQEALTIDGTRYILVEFHTGEAFHNLRDGLNHLIYAGYIPILAHTERYQCLRKNYELVESLIELGVYTQLNLSGIKGSLAGLSSIFTLRLLNRNWVHFLGTDAHNFAVRAPIAKEAVSVLKRKYGMAAVEHLLWDNPMTMFEDRHLML